MFSPQKNELYLYSQQNFINTSSIGRYIKIKFVLFASFAKINPRQTL